MQLIGDALLAVVVVLVLAKPLSGLGRWLCKTASQAYRGL